MLTTPTHPGTATIATTRDGRIEITFDRARLFGVRGCACEDATCTDGAQCWPEDWTVKQTPEEVLVGEPDSDLGDLDTLLTQAERWEAGEAAEDLQASAAEWAGVRGDGSTDHGLRRRILRAAAEHA